MFKYNSKGRRVNPCVQVATSMTQVFKLSLAVPEAEPQFNDKKVNKIYDDPMFHNIDPIEIEHQKEYDALVEKQSQIAANTQNPVNPD